MILARNHAFDIVVVDVERVLEIDGGPIPDVDAAVDLLALVAPGESEREAAVDGDLAAVFLHATAGDVDVGILDDEAGFAAAPGDVERAHILRDEMPLDTRTADRLGHHAGELGRASNGNGIGGRTERRHHAGQHAIAFLQVGARDMERDVGVVAPCGPAAERDVGRGS